MASFDMVKFDRGQVWVVRFKNREHYGHEIQKDRPWVVLSINKFNESCRMVTCAPLSTQDHVKTPSQVLIKDLRGKTSVVQCEQIRTFDYDSGAYIFDYMGTLTNDIMEKVDVALSIHLGMHYSPITLKSLYDSMEAVIKSVAYMQNKSNTPKFTDDDIIDFARKLKEQFKESIEGVQNNNVLPEDSSKTTEVINEIHNNTIEIGAPDDSKPSRISWTKENCEEFIKDSTTLPTKVVMDKWNISTKARFYSMKNYVKNLLLTKYQ